MKSQVSQPELSLPGEKGLLTDVDVRCPTRIPSGKKSRELGNTILVRKLLTTKSRLGVRDGRTGVVLVAEMSKFPVVQAGVIGIWIGGDEATVFTSRVA